MVDRMYSSRLGRDSRALVLRQFTFRMVAVLAWSLVVGGHGSWGDDRRPLDHDAYDLWKSVSGRQLSADGKWFSYQTSQGWGEAERRGLTVRSTASDVEYVMERGRSASFTADSRFLCLIVDPDPAAVKKATADKLPEDQRPQPLLMILNLETGKSRTTVGVRSFALPAEGRDWIAYSMASTSPAVAQRVRGPLEPEFVPRQNSAGVTTLVRLLTPRVSAEAEKPTSVGSAAGSASVAASGSGAAAAGPAASSGGARGRGGRTGTGGGAGSAAGAGGAGSGSTLVIEQLSSGAQWRFPQVSEFRFNKAGTQLAWIDQDETQAARLWKVVLGVPLSPLLVHSAAGKLTSIAFPETGDALGFVDQSRAEGKQPSVATVQLYQADSEPTVRVVAGPGTAGIPESWSVQADSPLSFSKSGKRLFFNTTPPADVAQSEGEKSESGETPVAKLDLWHWSEPLLQTVQQVQVNRLRQRNYRAVYHLESEQVLQLAGPETPTVVIAAEDDSDFGVMVTAEPYQVERTWESPGYSDVWLIDVRNGKRERVLERVQASVQISPAGQYLYWWDGQERQWFAMSTKNRRVNKISAGIPHPLFNEDHDTPMIPPSYGTVGWSENDRQFWLYDRYDLWQVDPSGKQAPRCLTLGQGRERQVRFRRVKLDAEEKFLPTKGHHLLTAFHDGDKSSGYFELQLQKESQLRPLLMLPESIGDLIKAKLADTVVVTRQDFRRFPDHWRTDLAFQSFQRLTHVNKQQNDFRWGSAELVEWQSSSGRPLQGLLYKPDNFDPRGRYPMIVYYYERNSDNLHRYYAPAAGRSTINISFYVSRGYVVFVPDIVYETAAPGRSAMECVLPGVDHVLAQGFVDERRMGLQGHSWGGYQTAYLVSQTDRFAAAEAGAPVSNMTSAYGGIRWESGLSRMFQYERTQSRIGATLWEAREAYIENSPLFYADQIRTPLLILHNDNDGAVPWYQGIELFMALRRLERPAWLVNYNGEPHGISKEENRRDFAIRMQQFFDHYLQEAPPAKWMVTGIPATEKGKDLGLQLVPEAESGGSEAAPPKPRRRSNQR